MISTVYDLPRTETAIAELAASSMYGVGGHLHPSPTIGRMGRPVADMPFDPARHSPLDINPLSPSSLTLGDMYGDLWVGTVLPAKPLHIGVISDNLRQSEHPTIADSRRHVMHGLRSAIENGLGSGDTCEFFSVGQSLGADVEEKILPDDAPIEVFAEELARDGLVVIMLGSYEKMAHGVGVKDGSLRGVTALKVNHPLELALPPGIGRVSTGRYSVVNTGKPKKLQLYNERLTKHHKTIVANLQTTGASIAQVVVHNRATDIPAADGAIASAITEAAKHKR
ncbi:MAG: hypothetical protein WBP26_00410 [Candidatus Saccharimonadales bacterium]